LQNCAAMMAPFSASLAPTGDSVVTWGEDTAARLWLLMPEHILQPASETESLYSVRYAPDGRTIAASSSDGTVRFWDPGTGTVTAQLKVPGGEVYMIAFSPDSRLIVTIAADGRGASLGLGELVGNRRIY
jgi:WD40 repeat protein